MRKGNKALVAKLLESGKRIKMSNTITTTENTTACRKFRAVDGSIFLLPSDFPDMALRTEIKANWESLSPMTARGAYAAEIKLLLSGYISQEENESVENDYSDVSENLDAANLARLIRFRELEANFYKLTGFSAGEAMALDLQERVIVPAAALLSVEDAAFLENVIRNNGKFHYVGRDTYSKVFNGACASRRSLVPVRTWAERLSRSYHPSFVAYIALRVWNMNATEL